MTISASDESFPYRVALDSPAIGMESEFKVLVDEQEVDPAKYWKHPSAFIAGPVVRRTAKACQIPSGGALYFDRDVIEVVTPVIELASQATARMVRNLWDGIAFVREELSRWEERSGHRVRLKAFSSHYNVSFEIPRARRSRNRTIQKLALLLAHVLPIPIIALGANRRSTGVGVRPRRNRLEVTLDFTPDPGLTVATAAAIVGITREVISWESYRLAELDTLPIAIPAGVNPGKHTTRKGWLTKDYHFSRSPFTSNIDEPIWDTTAGDRLSLREMAFRTTWFFRDSIRRYSDPFTVRLMFAVLRGHVPSLLDLPDRPAAYEDVGRLSHWGMILPELKNYENLTEADTQLEELTLQEHRSWRDAQRALQREEEPAQPVPARRSTDARGSLLPPWAGEQADRRLLGRGQSSSAERRREQRRRIPEIAPARLNYSVYEQVFRKLGSGSRLKFGEEILTPVGMKGWSQAIFRRESDGREQLLSIDQLLQNMNHWI